uniref:Uncharacterized protein n=1 Tax=Anopheles minimus TaxID=112268 RepID=A0A182W3J2_9DIPT
MAANAGTKIFRDFFRDSPCRMAYLLKPAEVCATRPLSAKIVARPKTAPNLPLNRTEASHITPILAQPFTQFDRNVELNVSKTTVSLKKQSPPSPQSRSNRKKPITDSIPARKDSYKKHRTTGSIVGESKKLNTVLKRDPQPRKPGCKVCLPNDPTGFLLNEIDHIRTRILDRPDSISCRQAIALAQDIRNRVDAIVLPAGRVNERETRVKFIGGRVESFAKMQDSKRKLVMDTVDQSTKRAKNVLERKILSSPLGGWMRLEEKQMDFKNQR